MIVVRSVTNNCSSKYSKNANLKKTQMHNSYFEKGCTHWVGLKQIKINIQQREPSFLARPSKTGLSSYALLNGKIGGRVEHHWK